jgi:hypothetical protein
MSTTTPPVDAVSDDRKAFETWFASKHGTTPLTWFQAEGGPNNVPDGREGHYFVRSTQQAWEAWQAAILALRTPAQGEPIGYMHHYRKIGGGAKYTELNHGEANQGQDPKEGFEWYGSAPVYAAPAQADLQALRADEGTRLLCELLAHMHRDGGHHHAAVGTEQAVNDAIKNWHDIQAENYALRADVERMRAALLAVKKIFDKDVTFVGGGPESHVRVPFESHDQSWNHWHEAREITRAAIDAAKKEQGS